jgi:hypothetical protein
MLARAEEEGSMLEDGSIEPRLRTSDELAPRYGDFTGGRLVKARTSVQSAESGSIVNHRGRDSQGAQSHHQSSIDQPIRSFETTPFRERNNDAVRELSVVQHGSSTRRPAHETDACAVTYGRIITPTGGLVAAKRHSGATPPVNTEHAFAWARTLGECVIHGHVLGTGGGRIDENPPL